MNWLNLNIQTLDSENFLGSDPIDRATWLCLLRYCIGQENSGEIAGCKTWVDRKWQQLVRVTKKESERQCDLWKWDGENLIVWGYPDEKEYEVQQLRELGRQTSDAKRAAAKANGAKGGRPSKTQEQNPTETHEEPKITQRKPIERKGKEGEGNENGKESPLPPKGGASAIPTIEDNWDDPEPTPEPPPLCTITQAIEAGTSLRISPNAVEFWWHTRNATGWTKGIAGGGIARPISNWRSDLAKSRNWAEEEASKSKAKTNGNTPKKFID